MDVVSGRNHRCHCCLERRPLRRRPRAMTCRFEVRHVCSYYYSYSAAYAHIISLTPLEIIFGGIGRHCSPPAGVWPDMAPGSAKRPEPPTAKPPGFGMDDIVFNSNDALQPESSQNGSRRTGLTLVLPPLSVVRALKAKKKGKGVGFRDETPVPKAPRPIKLKPLKTVLSRLILQIKKCARNVFLAI